MDTFYPFVPQEVMPKDYGGTADTIDEIHKRQKELLLENVDFFKENEKIKTDESKRIGKPKNATDLFGIEGSFKKLDID